VIMHTASRHHDIARRSEAVFDLSVCVRPRERRGGRVGMQHIQILVELMRKWVFRDPIVPLALKGIFAVSTGQETHPFSPDFRNNSTGYCMSVNNGREGSECLLACLLALACPVFLAETRNGCGRDEGRNLGNMSVLCSDCFLREVMAPEL
jgi:hypothetical protein